MTKITEQNNPLSKNIDSLNVIEMLKIINQEDSLIPSIINKHLESIEKVIEEVVFCLKNNGRLFYIGCGSSGRLGVLDAAECPPTFSVSSELIQGIIAGGYDALHKSIEGAEDVSEEGKNILIKKQINKNDIIIGITASGSAEFVLGALEYAKSLNVRTALITFNQVDHKKADNIISLNVGPEVIAGSTRLKSGTATKMILNMISTVSMIKLNKTYKNIMVDLKISNKKLLDRGIKIISFLTDSTYLESKELLKESKNNIKIAIVMKKLSLDYNSSKEILIFYNGNLEKILN